MVQQRCLKCFPYALNDSYVSASVKDLDMRPRTRCAPATLSLAGTSISLLFNCERPLRRPCAAVRVTTATLAKPHNTPSSPTNPGKNAVWGAALASCQF